MYKDIFNCESIQKELQTRNIVCVVRFCESIDSTNVLADQMAKSGALHGTLIVADRQTAGRGRRGRTWESPAGRNLYFTLILRPDIMPDKASMLTLVMAQAVQQAVSRQAQVPCCIKWPNDLVMNGKKITGILTEMHLEAGKIGHVLIGVGVNVGMQEFPDELADKATGIEHECGRMPDRNILLAEILKAFEEEYELFLEKQDLSGMRERYNACLVNYGREVRVLDPKGEYNGIALGINNAGELIVELPDRTLTTVYSGEVSVRGIYGYV